MNYIVINLICLLLSFGSIYPDMGEKAYTETVTGETTINGLKIEEHTITAYYRGEEELVKRPYLNATIRFPQILGMKDISVQRKINQGLKDAVTQSLNQENSGKTFKLFHDIVYDRYPFFWYSENEYKILSAENESIGINYDGTIYFGRTDYLQFSDYITFSLIDGERIPFTERFSREKVIQAIEGLKYDWIKGEYIRRYKGRYERYEPEEVEKLVSTVRKLGDTADNWGRYFGTTYYFAMDREEIIGYAISFSKNEYNYGIVTWVTQLVVHDKYRQRGIAKNLLFSIWGFSNHFAWGIVSANPYAIRALEKATRRRAVPMRIKKNSTKLKNIGRQNVPFIYEDTQFQITEDSAAVNTNFFVDHSDTMQMLKNVITEEVPWNLGLIDEGWEWFAFTFNDQKQIELSQQEIAKKLNISRPWVSKLLARAEELGIVKIEVLSPFANNVAMENALMEKYHLKYVEQIEMFQQQE